MDHIWHYDSPLGGITMAGEGGALTGLWFDRQKVFAPVSDREHEETLLPVFSDTVRWLDSYFGGRVPDFTPKLLLRGTGYRLAVWNILLTVPYGKTVTYGEIAELAAAQTGMPRASARAAGGAVGHNPVSLIVPCHRVIGADGSVTGYAGGIERKIRLLEMERAGAARI